MGPLLLIELHSEQCRCGGGSYVVAAGKAANPKCGVTPVGTTYMSMDEWTALGKPGSTEAQRLALGRLADRRESPRVKASVNVRLFRGDQLLGLGVTENLGEGGAMLLTPVSLAKGDVVVIEELEGLLRVRSRVDEVMAVGRGSHNAPVFRVRVRFLDPEAPRHVRKLLYLKSRPPE
jgi:hypothetical protein